MPEKDIKTGFEELDNDLQTLFEVCESGKLKAIKEAIADLSLSNEQFEEIVPIAIPRLAYGFLTDEVYQELLKQLPKSAVAVVEKAKSLIEKHFPGILEHPVVESWLEEEDLEEETLVRDKLNTISRITWLETWVRGEEGGKRVPSVRIGFNNEQGKIVLGSTLEWEELSTRATSVTGVFAGMLEDNKQLAEANQLDLSRGKGVAKQIEDMQRHLDEIRDFAPAFGINVEEEPQRTMGKDSV